MCPARTHQFVTLRDNAIAYSACFGDQPESEAIAFDISPTFCGEVSSPRWTVAPVGADMAVMLILQSTRLAAGRTPQPAWGYSREAQNSRRRISPARAMRSFPARPSRSPSQPYRAVPCGAPPVLLGVVV